MSELPFTDIIPIYEQTPPYIQPPTYSTRDVDIRTTSFDQVKSLIKCQDCKVKITFVGRKQARYCPYCSKSVDIA